MIYSTGKFQVRPIDIKAEDRTSGQRLNDRKKVMGDSSQQQALTGHIRVLHGGVVMRKILLSLLMGALLAGTTGCIIPAYSGDPAKRTNQLYNTSEDMRQIEETWERVWMLDQPSHMTPYRTHGGIT